MIYSDPSPPVPSGKRRTIRVALDGSPASSRLVDAAVRLAAEMEAVLEAVLIEDIRLIRLASLAGPTLAWQFSRHSPALEPIGAPRLERELRIQARKVERLLVEAATRARVECSFRVVRGQVEAEIRAAAADTGLLVIWGAPRAVARRTSGVDPGEIVGRRDSEESDHRAILILSGENPALRDSLVPELIREHGHRLLLVAR